MEYSEIRDLIDQQGVAARKRHDQVKRLIYGTWLYMIILTAVGAFSIGSLTNTNAELVEVIERRSPILEYLSCSNDLKIERDKSQTNYLIAWTDAASSDSVDPEILFKTRAEYYEADARQAKLEGCSQNIVQSVREGE